MDMLDPTPNEAPQAAPLPAPEPAPLLEATDAESQATDGTPADSDGMPSRRILMLAQRRMRNVGARQRIDAVEWQPTQSTARIDRDVTLYSETVQRGFHYWYGRAQISSFLLTEVLNRMSNQSASDEVERILDARIDALETDLRAEMDRVRAVQNDAGLRVERKFTKPKVLKNVPIFTAQAGRVLRAIEQYDELLWMLDALKITGHIRNSDVLSVRSGFRRKLTEMAREMSRLWTRAKNSAQRQREQENLLVSATIARLQQQPAAVVAQEGTPEADALDEARGDSISAAA